MNIFLLGLTILGIFISFNSIKKAKSDQFYADTFFLTPLGIFVWGDGMVLGSFWSIASLLLIVLNPELIWVGRFYLLFWIIRSGYEVIYWLDHQATESNYEPPFFRNMTWIKTNDSKILYQVFHSSIVTLSLFLLLYSYGT